MPRADRNTRMCRWAGLAVILFAGIVCAADAPLDPPGRIGALSEFEGSVQNWPGDENNWTPAELNMPVTSGDALATNTDGRATVRIGSAVVRIAADSQANFRQIDDAGVLIEVVQGSLRARLRSLARDDRFVFAVGDIRLEARDAADFRVDHDATQQRATLRVFSGRIQVLGADENILLTDGQQTDIDVGARRVLSLSGLAFDGFDDWFDARERAAEPAEALRYVSPETTGIEALAGQGDWHEEASVGAIWFPNTVAVGWTPYRDGRWAYVRPWGWTWIDNARWGFVTCHYGRWALVGNRWGWVPGRRIARPIYAPALVGFYGVGPQAGAAIEIGGGPGVGWFPLGPAEIYRPAYASSARYMRQLNSTHVANGAFINSPPSYRYAHQAEAVTIVPRAAFVGARPVSPAMMRIDPDQLRQIPIANRPVLPPPAVRGGQAPRWQPGWAMPPHAGGRPLPPNALPPTTDKRLPHWPAPNPQTDMPRPVAPQQRPVDPERMRPPMHNVPNDQAGQRRPWQMSAPANPGADRPTGFQRQRSPVPAVQNPQLQRPEMRRDMQQGRQGRNPDVLRPQRAPQ